MSQRHIFIDLATLRLSKYFFDSTWVIRDNKHNAGKQNINKSFLFVCFFFNFSGTKNGATWSNMCKESVGRVRFENHCWLVKYGQREIRNHMLQWLTVVLCWRRWLGCWNRKDADRADQPSSSSRSSCAMATLALASFPMCLLQIEEVRREKV
jgi:hypothetical protein